jgi:cytochrome c-type biogenesis protein CcmH/NrfG
MRASARRVGGRFPIGLSALAGTIHSYPTQAEVWKKLGDAYMRTKRTGFTSGALKKLLQWRR